MGKKQNANIIVWIGLLGAGIGAAVGAAMDNIVLGSALGGALGGAIGGGIAAAQEFKEKTKAGQPDGEE
ncbi:MAG: hypothetical protein IPM53_11255 [Anaerolineaceae bacterium]|nr:hypothetical protein [Anaerolineaceae bacterium]